MSLWDGITETKLRSPGVVERHAVRLLAPVGGEREWWWWNRRVLVGHLRVALTAEEAAVCPPGCAVADAGESGPERRRRRVPC